MSKYNPVREVERVAQELVKQLQYCSMAEFTAQDIRYIASEAQVGHDVVLEVLEPAIIQRRKYVYERH